MKKILSIFFTLCILFASAGSVFAADQNGIIKNTNTVQNPEQPAVRAKTDADCLANPTSGCLNYNGGNGSGSGTGSTTGEKQQSVMDIYAPFARTGDDIFCKVPKEVCDKDGCFDYSIKGPCPVGVYGVTVQRLTTDRDSEKIIGAYIALVFRYALGLGAAASILMIVVGGVQIIISMGDTQERSKGGEKIQQGAIGIGLLILAATILYTINPLFFTF